MTITELNNILGYTIEEAAGDEGGSGLSSVGGTSVTSFRLENVNYTLEDGEGNLLYEEMSNKFVSEELNTVIQRSDGTFLSVDTRSVSHGGGSGNPIVSGVVSGDTMTLTLNDASTVDVDVTSGLVSLVQNASIYFEGSTVMLVDLVHRQTMLSLDTMVLLDNLVLQNSGITYVDDGNNVVGT